MSRCVHYTGSVFLSTFGIIFTFVLYMVTGALILFSSENGLARHSAPQEEQQGGKLLGVAAPHHGDAIDDRRIRVSFCCF